MNDLIAEGVANDTMNILLMEMGDLYLVRTWTDEGVEYVRFQSPALGMYNEWRMVSTLPCILSHDLILHLWL